MNDKQIFYAVKNDDGSCGEFKPFELGEIPSLAVNEQGEEKTYNINDIDNALNVIAVAIESAFDRAYQELLKQYKQYKRFTILYNMCCQNKRVANLALHAKKARTRKKNMNRIIKTVLKENERTMKIDEKDSDKRD